jgi:hypothetical protein
MGGGTGMVRIAGVTEAWKRNCAYQLWCGCASGLELGCLIEAGEVERVMVWDEAVWGRLQGGEGGTGECRGSVGDRGAVQAAHTGLR